jgi:peptidylprolyl isomerase
MSQDAPTVEAGDAVRVHYTGKLNDGSVFDSSEGRDPLGFTVGAGELIPGFDAGVEGMSVGEKRTLQIEPGDAYGDRNEQAVVTVPREQLGDLAEKVSQGDQLMMQTGEDQQVPVTVTELSDNEVTLDANHPLAGKQLTFEVELVELDKKAS